MINGWPFGISYILLWIVVLFQGGVILELVRRQLQHTDTSNSPERLGPLFTPGMTLGDLGPEFSAVELPGHRIMDSAELKGETTLLGFVSPNCGQCEESVPLMAQAAGWADAKLVLVCAGSDRQCGDFAERFAEGHTLLCDETGAVANLFHLARTPGSVLIDPAWRIVKYGAPGAVRQDDGSSGEAQLTAPTIDANA